MCELALKIGCNRRLLPIFIINYVLFLLLLKIGKAYFYNKLALPFFICIYYIFKLNFNTLIMSKYKFFLTDFVEIQRKSFRDFLQKGFIEEFYKRNPITNSKKNIEIFFYPEYYQLTVPDLNPRNAIIKGKSYSSKIFIPVQLTDRKNKKIFFQWAFLGNLPIMTKRGHFILNGAARVIVNQILRSPGIYYHEKNYLNDQIPSFSYPTKPLLQPKEVVNGAQCFKSKENCEVAKNEKGDEERLGNSLKFIVARSEESKQTSPLLTTSLRDKKGYGKDENSNTSIKISKNSSFKRFYADIICVKGTWLRIEIGKDRRIWAQMKKIPKIPIFWFLMAMGLTEKIIYNSIIDSTTRLEANIDKEKPDKIWYPYVQTPPQAWREVSFLLQDPKSKVPKNILGIPIISGESALKFGKASSHILRTSNKEKKNIIQKRNELLTNSLAISNGRKWIFNRFLNPRTYDLGNFGRHALNKKLGLSISKNQTTLTSQDILKATDYLIKVEKGLKKIDDIDNLKNKRVRTSGELLQIQIATGLLRLEKVILDKINNLSFSEAKITSAMQKQEAESLRLPIKKKARFDSKLVIHPKLNKKTDLPVTAFVTPKGYSIAGTSIASLKRTSVASLKRTSVASYTFLYKLNNKNISPNTLLNNLINSKVFNSSLKEFFGTSPLSQFMDQINPLAEITHKRRLTSMGPGGVSRDSATLAIRGIHPTHYGRICPIETPEGKNTGLVNSMTAFARVNEYGLIETPFYKVYKGQVQKNTGMFYFASEYEEKIKLAAPDLLISKVGFLPKNQNPVRIVEDFTKISRKYIEYIGVSSIQMVSIATSLIPFLEHDDANRALMGSNMQRQAVPLIRPERPIVTTGLESRVVSDSGQAIQAIKSGVVTFASSEKIIVFSL